MIQRYSQFNKTLTVILLCVAATACASRAVNVIRINSTIPEPILEKLPLVAGVVFTEEFSNFSSLEKPQARNDWKLDFGDSHKAVFETVLNGLFTDVVPLQNVSAASSSPHKIDVILVPNIDDISLLTASDGGGKFFAISMRHIVQIHSPTGANLEQVTINSYGRQRAKFGLLSGNDEVNIAAHDAFRDVAVSAFAKIPRALSQAGIINIADDLTKSSDEP